MVKGHTSSVSEDAQPQQTDTDRRTPQAPKSGADVAAESDRRFSSDELNNDGKDAAANNMIHDEDAVSPRRAADERGFNFTKIFIFTNPTSGGNKAAAFTKTAVSQLVLTEPCDVNILIFDIREGNSGEKPGFLALRDETDRCKRELEGFDELGQSSPEQPIYVLVAGGDGTVMWCVDEIQKTNVDQNFCAIGVVPYGTGNDFANAFGWRPFNKVNPFDTSLQTLKSIVESCMRAAVVYHDLWAIFVSVGPGGRFTKINSDTRKKEVVTADGKPVDSLFFRMSNYFSMGVESRIGRGFDKHRTKSQTLNRMRYGIEGFKKTFITRTKRVDQIILSFTENPGTEEEAVIFTTDKALAKEKHIPFLSKCASLVALNIPSFSGGNDIWSPSRKIATFLDNREEQKKARKLVQTQQLMGDEKLEFISFSSVPSLGMEFIFHGRGARVHSGGGPWKFLFKPVDESTRLYFQTDGEFYQLTNPAFVTVKHERRIRVLSLKPSNLRMLGAD